MQTAAHCIKGDIHNIVVTLNAIDKGNQQNSELILAMNWELHEGYQKLDRAVYNDIGLIYLVDGHRTVPPVKLDFNDNLRPGNDVAVIGFGTDGGGTLSETLHVLHTEVTSDDYCRNTFGIIVEEDKHFCTGILNEAKVRS